MLDRWASEKPGQPAFVSAHGSMTFAAMRETVGRIAKELRERGVQPGDVVAVALPELRDALVTWSIFHEAAIAVPYHQWLVGNDQVKVALFVTGSEIEGIPPDQQLVADAKWMKRVTSWPTQIEPRRYPSLDSTCMIALTSGTTGNPKAVPMSIDLLLRRSANNPDPTIRDAGYMMMGPSNFGFGSYYRHASTFNGATFYLRGRTTDETLMIVHHFRLAGIYTSPNQFARLISLAEKHPNLLEHVRFIWMLGSSTPSVLVERLHAINPAIACTNVYSGTEFARVAIRREPAIQQNLMGTIADDVVVEIVDDDGNPVPAGETGVIRVRTQTMATGYFNDPETTSKFFRDGYFYPGDTGWIERGDLYLAGRQTEIINSGGTKIDPNTVDDVVMRVKGVTGCAAFSIPSDVGIDVVACAVVTDQTLSESQLTSAVFKELGPKTPKKWFFLDDIPYGPTGKPLRRELSEKFSGHHDEASEGDTE